MTLDASLKKYFDMSVSCANKGDRLSSPFVYTIVLFSRSYASPRNFFSTLYHRKLLAILSSRLSNLDPRFSKHRGSRIEFRVETVNICCLSFRNGLPASFSDELECQQRRTLRMIIIKRLCRKPKYPHFAEEDLLSPPPRNYPYLQPSYTPSPREINTDHLSIQPYSHETFISTSSTFTALEYHYKDNILTKATILLLQNDSTVHFF